MEELLILQDLDLKADKLRSEIANMPERAAYEASMENLQTAQSDLTRAVKEHEDQSKTVKKLEGRLELLVSRIRQEEAKLYSGKTANPKELMSIQQEIESLRTEKDKEETDYLEELEKLDPLTRSQEQLKEAEAALVSDSGSLKEELDAKTVDLNSKLEETGEAITAARKKIPVEILDLYDKLRKSKQGLAVALVRDGICEGCTLALSTDEADKMTYEHDIPRCEHCRRILVER